MFRVPPSDIRPLSVFQLFGFGFLSLPISLGLVSLITFAPTYYAIDLGFGLTSAGFVFAASRILDVLTDPMVGHLSDQTRSPIGRRLPWMMIGAVIMCPVFYLIMAPTPDMSLGVLAALIAVFFVGLTLIDLPYSAVGLEISPFTDERTLLAAVKAIFQIFGAIGASLLIVMFARDSGLALEITALITAALTVLGVVLFCTLTPYANRESANFTRQLKLTLSPVKALKAMTEDRDYGRLLLAFGLAQAGSTLSVGLMALLVLRQIQAPELTGVFIGILLLFTALAVPFWTALAKRIGKARTWQYGLGLGVLLMLISVGFVGGNIWVFGLFCALFGFIVAGDVILPTSLLADIVSDKPEETVRHQAGAMLGFKNAVSKLGFILPMLLAFPILGALGVDEAETLNSNQYWALVALFGLVPALIRLAAWVTFRTQQSAS